MLPGFNDRWSNLPFNTYDEALEYYKSHPELINQINNNQNLRSEWSALLAYLKAMNTGDMVTYQSELGASGYGDLSPAAEKGLDNLISQQLTGEARNYETQMRDTSLLSSGSQLSQLGLSTSGVLQTGGALSNGVGIGRQSSLSASSLAQQKAINTYNQRMGLAKSLISTAGSMASSGIYGGSLGLVRHAGSVLASSAAHSAFGALTASKWNGQGNGSLMSGKLAEEWSKLPGAY